MKRQYKVIAGLTLLILLNIASSNGIYWMQSRELNALSVYFLTVEVDKYLLECRRQEKNFFLRTSMEAIQMYTANHNSASNRILSLMQKRIPENSKNACSTLRDLMINYMKAFRATSLHRRDHPSGDQMASMMHMCANIARECHSQLASIIVDSEQRYHSARRVNRVIPCILLISTPIVSILIASIIVMQVAAPRKHG